MKRKPQTQTPKPAASSSGARKANTRQTVAKANAKPAIFQPFVLTERRVPFSERAPLTPEAREHWWLEPALSAHLQRNPEFARWWQGDSEQRRSKRTLKACRWVFFVYEAEARRNERRHLMGVPIPYLNDYALMRLCHAVRPTSGVYYEAGEFWERWRGLMNEDPGTPLRLESDPRVDTRELVTLADRESGAHAAQKVAINFDCSLREIRAALNERKAEIGLPAEISINRVMRWVAQQKTALGRPAHGRANPETKHDTPWHHLEWLDELSKPENRQNKRRLPSGSSWLNRRRELFRLVDAFMGASAGREWLEEASYYPPESWAFH